MRRNTTLICLAAAFGLALLPPAARAEASVSHFQDESAHAYFTGVDSTGCIYSMVDVNAYEDRFQAPPGPPQRGSWATLYVYQYDYCQDVTVRNFYGLSELTADALTVSGGLKSARVATVLTLFDYVSGGQIQASLDLTWTGTGDLFQGGGSSHFNGPQYGSFGRYRGSSRQAELAGTIVVGSTNIELGADGYASIQSSQSGTIYHNR